MMAELYQCWFPDRVSSPMEYVSADSPTSAARLFYDSQAEPSPARVVAKDSRGFATLLAMSREEIVHAVFVQLKTPKVDR